MEDNLNYFHEWKTPAQLEFRFYKKTLAYRNGGGGDLICVQPQKLQETLRTLNIFLKFANHFKHSKPLTT